MTWISGFPPVVNRKARILILGSMPSVESLRQQQYYGHPQNAFWTIMGELVNAGRDTSYSQRLAILQRKRIALWDSVHSCRREGSLDSAIEAVVANDFTSLFAKARSIRAIFFNGRKSEELFMRYAHSALGEAEQKLSYFYLPSTSPAHAGMKREKKLDCWREILAWL